MRYKRKNILIDEQDKTEERRGKKKELKDSKAVWTWMKQEDEERETGRHERESGHIRLSIRRARRRIGRKSK